MSSFVSQLSWNVQPRYGPGVESASNKIVYQEFPGRGKARTARKTGILTAILEPAVLKICNHIVCKLS
jgi:hypothetical protein